MKSIACFVTIGLAAASPWASAQVTSGDFNNDGLADLAVGVPDELKTSFQFDSNCFCGTTVEHPGAGGVNIVYGGTNGLNQAGSQSLSRGSSAFSEGAHYGRALAAGKFRGSSAASDLVVAVPGITTRRGAIAVHFSASGRLNVTPNQTFYGDQFSAATGSAIGGSVGFRNDLTMASGDFNGDGFADLAVEVSNLSQGGSESDSGVLVLRGTLSGLSSSTAQVLVISDVMAPHPVYRRDCDRVRDCIQLRGHVGLAAADLNADGRDDLVIGSSSIRRLDDDGDSVDAGARPGIIVITGTSSGLAGLPTRAALTNGTGPNFGDALAIGDFTGDGVKDVAVGDPSTTLTGSRSVVVFRSAGSTSSFVLRQSDVLNQVDEAEDRFGAALAALDMNGDGATDLAVGSPGESVGTSTATGAVTLFLGAPGADVGAGGRTTVTQSQLMVPRGVTCCFNGAAFGTSLAAGNYGLGAPADLAIGSPSFTLPPGPTGSGIGTVTAAGSVLALHGAQLTPIVPVAPFLQLWTQNRGLPVCTTGSCFVTAGTAAANNHFGSALR